MRFLNAKGLAKAALLAGVLLAGGGSGQAQTAATTVVVESKKDSAVKCQTIVSETIILTGDEAAKTTVAGPTVAGPAAVVEGAPSATCASDLSAGVDWTKVPPPVPFPRLGGCFFLPTGSGYYSLKDVLLGEFREKPPVYPWPPFSLDVYAFYDNNFRYLDDPENTQHDWLDPIKRIHLGDNWLLSFGGEERIRYNNERDSRLGGKNNVFESLRSRVYGDLWYRDIARIYVEGLDARIYNNNLAPLASDINHFDVINLFADVKLGELADHPVYLRGGRQELNYGSQRLISQTDFPNANRTFDGLKAFWHGDCLDVDAFWTRPVVVNPTKFDSENDKASFGGLWATYRPAKKQLVDLYYLYLDNDTPLTPRPRTGRGGFDCDTLGSRYAGDWNMLVWDFEGMYQFGQHGAQTTSAAAYTTGAGFHLGDLPMNPTFWVYYDFASGSHNPGHGDFGTFNQLFPNGHNYFGWTDLVGRQNIEDVNFQTWLYPTKWIAVGGQLHFLRLDSAKDALYNAAGAVERSDPTGKAGTDVGNVLTGIVNFHLSMHSDVLLQYSHLYAGDYLKATGSGRSPDLFYAQYTFRW